MPFRTTNGATTIAPAVRLQLLRHDLHSVQVSRQRLPAFRRARTAPTGGDSNTLDQLLRNVRIAPLWDNLRTDQNQSAASGSTPGNIFVDSTVANQITIRWAATRQDTGGGDVNFSVTLFANGNVRFDYGDGNQSLTPTVGLSAGNGFTFVTSRLQRPGQPQQCGERAVHADAGPRSTSTSAPTSSRATPATPSPPIVTSVTHAAARTAAPRRCAFTQRPGRHSARR